MSIFREPAAYFPITAASSGRHIQRQSGETMSTPFMARLAGLIGAALAASAIGAGSASAYFVQPCSVSGPQIQLTTYTSPISGLSQRFVSQADQCYTANSTVSVKVSASWSYYGGTSWGPFYVTRPVNGYGDWPAISLPIAPCRGSQNSNLWQTETIVATDASGAPSNTLTIPIPPC
jgi:hypothetical protein